jgi:hypothetical protein
MGLSTLRLQKAKIELPNDQSFDVRGLTLNDVQSLATDYGPALAGLYQKIIVGTVQDLGAMEMALIGRTLLESAPDLASAIIAHGAGEPDSIDVVREIPFPAQLEALERIFDQTFRSEADLKKVVEIVTRALEATTSTLAFLQSPATKT